ncbi:MAG: HEAT repeat domain-containing protein [Firmicutes bacterium]|nr:HEAT repeat domain-containing protein [Bacillota bacterium]
MDSVVAIIIDVFVILMVVVLGLSVAVLMHRYVAQRRQLSRTRRLDELSREYLLFLVAEGATPMKWSDHAVRLPKYLLKEFLVRVARQIKGDMQVVVRSHYESLGYLEQDLLLLRSRFKSRRIKAMARLEVMATDKCLPGLIHALRTDRLVMLRVRVAQTLYRLGYKEYEEFVRLLTLESRVMMLVLAETLIHIGGAVVPYLTKFVEDYPASPNAGLAVRIIGEIGASSAVPCLMQFIESEKSEVRINAVRALTQCEGRDATDSLASRLTDPHPVVRMMAVRALATLGAMQYEQDIVARLTDGDSRVSKEAAMALQQFGWTGENLPVSQQWWFTFASRHRSLPVEELP